MDFSVVIPCHNNAPWIGETLASVASQTMPPREVIVVDDASDDGSVEAARASGVPFTLIRSEARNAAAARNLGISKASGRFVAFLDADDWWFPQHLESAANLLSVRQDTIALMNHRQASASGGEPWVDIAPISAGDIHGACGRDFVDVYLTKREGWPTGAFVVERALLDKVGGFDVAQRKRHDLELLFRLMQTGAWCYTPTPTWAYRDGRAGSISSVRGDAFLYHLKAEFVGASLFPDARWESKIAGTLRRSLSYAAAEDDVATVREAYALGGGRLDRLRRAYYAAYLRTPAVGRVKNALRGRPA
jgi:glycosyltransferase involved in cell wall biosynthesis